MKKIGMRIAPFLAGFLLLAGGGNSGAAVLVQCGDPGNPKDKCMHLSSGDGFVTMADGKVLYTFGFGDITASADPLIDGMLAAEFTGPTISLDEGDRFFLNLTNVGMMMRPDLFDPHSLHWHGFPNASNIFDGEPHGTIGINMGSTLTYFYNVVEPGTYMYHCHVEATEHMEMGMLSNLYVRPRQNGTPLGTCDGGAPCTMFAYNDGDGSTGYDVEYPIQVSGFDGYFHEQHIAVQPLPFHTLRVTYPVMNGRGYPDTVNPNPLPPPAENGGKESQRVSSLINASPGQKVLLRLSSLSVHHDFTLAALGIPMRIVGRDARLLRGPDGKDLSYVTNSILLGSGETADAILDIPPDTAPGTRYFLYTTNLNFLSNDQEDFGGMMTEIRIN
ncbi:MAG: multicopper oxidase domain-containing protein [Deltaproteobacteria bacterium]|nr:multicopper oxidase domain-containing protein [Deltaproteobacteria bacterium]